MRARCRIGIEEIDLDAAIEGVFAVVRHVQDPVAEALLRGQVADGSTLSVDIDPDDPEGFALSLPSA